MQTIQFAAARCQRPLPLEEQIRRPIPHHTSDRPVTKQARWRRGGRSCVAQRGHECHKATQYRKVRQPVWLVQSPENCHRGKRPYSECRSPCSTEGPSFGSEVSTC